MRLNRATVVYGGMILSCAAGLWVVLSMGERLVPPEDLAGKWSLEPRNLAAGTAPKAAFGPGMDVDQSGRFFQIAIENGPQLSLKLDDQSYMDIPGMRIVRLALVGEPWRLTIEGPPGGDEMVLRIAGPQLAQSGEWTVRRLVRTFASGGGGGD